MYLQKFDKAAEDVKNLAKRPSDDDLLLLYALFKQGVTFESATFCFFSCIKTIFSFSKFQSYRRRCQHQ